MKGYLMPSRRIDTTAPLRATHLSRRTLGAVAGAALAATTLPGQGPRAETTAAQSATPLAAEGSADLAAATDQFVRARP